MFVATAPLERHQQGIWPIIISALTIAAPNNIIIQNIMAPLRQITSRFLLSLVIGCLYVAPATTQERFGFEIRGLNPGGNAVDAILVRAFGCADLMTQERRKKLGLPPSRCFQANDLEKLFRNQFSSAERLSEYIFRQGGNCEMNSTPQLFCTLEREATKLSYAGTTEPTLAVRIVFTITITVPNDLHELKVDLARADYFGSERKL